MKLEAWIIGIAKIIVKEVNSGFAFMIISMNPFRNERICNRPSTLHNGFVIVLNYSLALQ